MTRPLETSTPVEARRLHLRDETHLDVELVVGGRPIRDTLIRPEGGPLTPERRAWIQLTVLVRMICGPNGIPKMTPAVIPYGTLPKLAQDLIRDRLAAQQG